LRGDYLAIVTLGFGEVVRVIIPATSRRSAAAWASTASPLLTNFFWVYLVVFVTVLSVAQTSRQSGHGRALLGIREDEIAAEAMGVPLTRYKVLGLRDRRLLRGGLAGGPAGP